MPTITVGNKTIEAPEDKRLVLALKDGGVNILHRCGGYARCTTCRVEFESGEPEQYTEAEKARLESEPALWGKVRLSCQVLCTHDMSVNPVMTLENSDVDSPGKRPEDHLTPEPTWVSP
ncbi:MAG: 2Fe-2S iron-sulfur cluster-binding protein [Anaerolineales bacterium]